MLRLPGRDDYPVRAMRNAAIAWLAFRHPSIESPLRELRRNPALLQACGFEVLPLQRRAAQRVVKGEDGVVQGDREAAEEAHWGVPSAWNMSRFLGNVIELEDCLGLVSGPIADLRESPMDVLPGFGRHLGFDGKAIESHSSGRVDRPTGQTSDPEADWGRHETHGVDGRTGKPWTKIKSWFGYGVQSPIPSTRSRWRCA